MSRVGSSGAHLRLDATLNSVTPRCAWGFQALPDGASKSSVLTIGNNEYALACGSSVCLYGDVERESGNRPSKVLSPSPHPDACQVTYMSLSNDSTQLAACFKLKGRQPHTAKLTAALYVYDLASQRTLLPSKPRHFSYTITYPDPKSLKAASVAAEIDAVEQHQFTSAAFSHDNVLLVCATNIPSSGCIIFDAIMGGILAQLTTTALVSQVVFNPKDANKLCTVGDDNMFQLWRLASNKTVHPSPIRGLSVTQKYTSLVWLDGEEGRIVAGSCDGFLIIVQGTEQLQQHPTPAWGNSGSSSSVASLLTRGDYIVAVSEFNFFSLLEVKRFSGSGAQAATAVLIPLSVFKFSDISVITSMQWAVQMSVSSLQYSFVAVVASTSALSLYDIKADTMGSKAGLENGGVPGAVKGNNLLIKSQQQQGADIPTQLITADRTMLNFHHGAVNNLAISRRTSTFATCSHADESVRVRNFSIPNGPSQVVSYFSEFKNQIPNFVDMHPTGMFVACACEDEAVEYMISDSSLGSVKRIPVKVPLTLPSGLPVVNTQPVSIVRYSNSGHLLAVVTGKFARVFNLLNLRINPNDMSGVPSLVMYLMDNTANITDLSFSKDDSRIFTTASDGCVYSWAVCTSAQGDMARSGEFNAKGVSANRVATHEDGLIVAVFDEEAVGFGENPQGASAHTVSQKNKLTRSSTQSESAAIHNSSGTGKKGLLNSRKIRHVVSASSNTTEEEDATSAIANTSSSVSGTTAQRFLMFWNHNVSPDKGECVYLPADCQVTAISLGSIDSPSTSRPVCVLGLADGRVLVSLLPCPLLQLNSLSASTLNTSLCKSLQLHKSAVSSVTISITGLWIFSAGADGTVFMLSTSIRARDTIMASYPPEETTASENEYVITEREQLNGLRSRLADVESIISEIKRDSERTITKLTESGAEIKSELEKRLKMEVKKRDEIIIRGREDLIKSNKNYNDIISKMKVDHAREISELESLYEKKLSKESLYLEKMRQAYDEFVLHARMDMHDLRAEVEVERKSLESSFQKEQQDTEKQKAALLLYVDFVNERNKEILDAAEEKHDETREKLKDDVSAAETRAERAQREGRSEIATLTIQNGKLKHTISTKEDDILRLESDLGWANDRIRKLEQALQEAATDMTKKTEISERWEFKAGEAQQQISELERIRKALTSQLHALRQELGPKEEKLSQVSERLQEVDREYELTLGAISEKEKALGQHGQNIALLQKQVREYRQVCSQRDKALRRAAKLLEEFKLALQEAQFKSYKRTVAGDEGGVGAGERALESEEDGGGAGTHKKLGDEADAPSSNHQHQKKSKIVEMMARTDGMENSLGRLSHLLEPYIKAANVTEDAEDESVLAAKERERQLQLLHKSLRGLQNNLENNNLLVQTKVGAQLSDNKILLEELNTLRQQVRSLSMENQRLLAKMQFSETRAPLPTSSLPLPQLLSSKTDGGDSGAKLMMQDSQSDSSLLLLNNNNGVGGKRGGGSQTSSKSLKSSGSNKIELQLSASNHSLDNMASSISIEAQRNAHELREQIMSQLSEARNNAAAVKSREASSHPSSSVPSSRQSAADKKIAQIMKENEDAIREGAAAEILASYQNQIGSTAQLGVASSSSNNNSNIGKKQKVASIPAVPRKAVPLSEELLNRTVALPKL